MDSSESVNCSMSKITYQDPPGGDLDVHRARFMTGGGYRLLASANLGELVLGCIEAKFRK